MNLYHVIFTIGDGVIRWANIAAQTPNDAFDILYQKHPTATILSV